MLLLREALIRKRDPGNEMQLLANYPFQDAELQRKLGPS